MSQVTERVDGTTKEVPPARGKRPHRAPTKREYDRKVIAELILRGETERSIARKLSLSAATVHRDVAAIQRRWEEQAVQQRDVWIARELANISLLERETWEGWKRSQLLTEKKTMKSRGISAMPQKGEKVASPQMLQVEQMHRTETNHGDVRYLELLERLAASRARLLGLYAPIKIAPTDPTGEEAYADARHKLLAALEQKAAHLAVPLPPGVLGAGEQPRLPEADVTLAEQPDGSYDATGESGDITPEVFEGLVIRR